MKNSLPLIIVVIVLLGAGYYFMTMQQTSSLNVKVETTVEPTTSAVMNKPLVLGPFKGTFPCADCSGLDTELTLTRSSTGSAEGTYVMFENYVGKSPKPIETRGKWTTLRGTKKNPDAVVYQLDPGKPEESEYYLKVNDNEIKMLDKEQNDIEGPFNYTLTK